MNGVKFIISKKDLVLASGIRLDYSELLHDRSFITVKKDRERTSEGGQRVPHYLVLSRPYILLPDHSHNIHLKLTRLELTTERSYQTHSHNIF